jgi:hypothetical protein
MAGRIKPAGAEPQQLDEVLRRPRSGKAQFFNPTKGYRFIRT